MASINIEIPAMEAEHSIEIEIRINGEKKKYNYRVEIFKWEGCLQSMSHVDCLKSMIKEYDDDWRVVKIGGPTNHCIPVVFKQISNPKIS